MLLSVIVGIGLSFFIPFHEEAAGWAVSHVYWAISIAQGILYVSAAILTFQAVFKVKELGGILGSSLRILGVGLILLGISQGQIPIMDNFNLWKTTYYNSGYYYFPYMISAFILSFGLFVAGRSYTKNNKIIVLATLVFIIAAGITATHLPHPVDAYGRTGFQYALTLCIESVLTGLSGYMLITSFLIKRAFVSSKLGRVFGIVSIAFIFNFVAVAQSFPLEFMGWNNFYVNSGIYYLPFFLTALSFVYFSLRLKYLEI